MKNKRTVAALLWKMMLIIFFQNYVLDSMTTVIVMTMVTDQLIWNTNDKLYYVSMIIAAANSGGAFPPAEDIPAVMTWLKGMSLLSFSNYFTGIESTRTNFWLNDESSVATQNISFAVRLLMMYR